MKNIFKKVILSTIFLSILSISTYAVDVSALVVPIGSTKRSMIVTGYTNGFIDGTQVSTTGRTFYANVLLTGLFPATTNFFSGKVGIGTTNPVEKLQITGNIKASGNIKSDLGVYVGLNPTTNHFNVGNLTTDGTWRSLDLSSIVPSGAKACFMQGYFEVGNGFFAVSPTNNQAVSSKNVFNGWMINVPGSSKIAGNGWITLPTNDSRTVYYYGCNDGFGSTTFDKIDLTVQGYTF